MLWLFLLPMLLNQINSVSYWDSNARWYKLWREHNNYHVPIQNLLLNFVWKGAKIIDIGAGDGVLSMPLTEKGCYVTALEPSKIMRSYLQDMATLYPMIKIDNRRFEELETFELKEFDVALACNSLHLTENGIEGGLLKIFSSRVRYVFLVTERVFSLNRLLSLYPEYEIIFTHSYLCESSFAYHCLEEIFDHWQFRMGRELSVFEKEKLINSMTYDGKHFWFRDFAQVNIFIWERIF